MAKHNSRAQKKQHIATGLHQLPTVFAPGDDLWNRMAALYVNLQEARHCIVHRRSELDANGALIISDRSGNPLQPVTSLEQDKFAESIHLLSDSVIRGDLSNRQKNRIFSALDHLFAHHRYPNTGIAVSTEIPKILVALMPISKNQWQLDIKRIRDYLVTQSRQPDVADLELYRPEETTARFFAHLEDLSGDALEFVEEALPRGIRSL